MIDWTAIETVMLDMDGTLLDLRFDNDFWHHHVPARYALLHGLELEQAKSEVMPRYHAAAGTLDWYCLDYWSANLGLDIPALKRELAHEITLRPLVPEFIAAVRARGLDIRLVTNAHPDAIDIKMAATGLAPVFDAIVCSHDLGAPKEDRGFWTEFQSRLPFHPGRSLFLDDSLPVLRSARDYGLGHLMGIYQPDSSQPEKDVEDFPAIRSFAEIMPRPATQVYGSGEPGPATQDPVSAR